MEQYKHILVALDLSDESSQVLVKAQSMAGVMQSELSVIHVVEPLTFAYGGDIPVDLTQVQSQLEEQAQKHLQQICEPLGLKPEQLHITVGQPAAEVHDCAEKLAADLIMVGSHGRKGLALLLGSTSNGVLHGAHTDVLAVHIK